MNQQLEIENLKKQVNELSTRLESLQQSFYKNNFSSLQTFSKDAVFQTRLKVPVYSSVPTVCEVGDIIAISGKLYICTVANTTWTLVGSQT